MVIPSLGAVINAAGMVKRREEEEKAPKKPTSEIHITIDDEEIHIEHQIANEFDWARAAWGLINTCKKQGQYENLKAIVKGMME